MLLKIDLDKSAIKVAVNVIRVTVNVIRVTVNVIRVAVNVTRVTDDIIIFSNIRFIKEVKHKHL